MAEMKSAACTCSLASSDSGATERPSLHDGQSVDLTDDEEIVEFSGGDDDSSTDDADEPTDSKRADSGDTEEPDSKRARTSDTKEPGGESAASSNQENQEVSRPGDS
jgi:hypothetical protein